MCKPHLLVSYNIMQRSVSIQHFFNIFTSDDYSCTLKRHQWVWLTILFINVSPQTRKTSLVAQMVKSLPAIQETWVQFLNQQDPLEKGMATHSSILAWKIPWMEEPGWLLSMGSAKSWTRLSDFTMWGFGVTNQLGIYSMKFKRW